ncbi:hypothetical protein F5Y15DRAFT_230561 [Xylariaceae sp. FL0016]|nr:hypothetical protein F5Y15DRAFT_230561 [Xylariaceae sp. FL0016]
MGSLEMLEPWDELLTLQKERALCAQDVQTIKDSCIADHGKKHPIQCEACWPRLINRMRDRYLHSANKEWFSGRRVFLQELDTLFTKARDHQLELKAIEDRIFDEKKEWYRDKVKSLGLQSATKTPTEARILQQKLYDRSLTTDQLASELNEAFSDSAVQNAEAFEGFIDRLKAAKTPKARTDAYIDIFFQPNHDPAGAAKCQKYIDMVEKGASIADALNAMLRDRQMAKDALEEKQRLSKRLDELKRAKAAHELDKTKRDQARQERAKAAAPPKQKYPYLPCPVCSGEGEAPVSCILCELLAKKYRVQSAYTVYCSDECWEKGNEEHVNREHRCAAGDDYCERLLDEDEPMDDGEDCFFCKECVLTLGIPSTWCSLRCLDANFQRHRNNVHIPEREKGHHHIDDHQQLEFSTSDRTRYRARRIEDHAISLTDAMSGYRPKLDPKVLSND